MGLFGGSTKSRTSTNQTSNSTTITTVNNVDARTDNRSYTDNSFRKFETTNIDARTDARQYIDASQKTVQNIDARQDNRQYTDNRQTNDSSVTVGVGGFYAGGNIEITEIDNGAVDAALALAGDNARLLAESTDLLVQEAFDQSSAVVDEAFNIVTTGNAALQATTLEALDAAYEQSEAAFVDQSQQNLMITGGMLVLAVAFIAWRAKA